MTTNSQDRLPYWNDIEKFYNDCIELDADSFVILKDLNLWYRSYWKWKGKKAYHDSDSFDDALWLADELEKYVYHVKNYMPSRVEIEYACLSYDTELNELETILILGFRLKKPEGMIEPKRDKNDIGAYWF